MKEVKSMEQVNGRVLAQDEKKVNVVVNLLKETVSNPYYEYGMTIDYECTIYEDEMPMEYLKRGKRNVTDEFRSIVKENTPYIVKNVIKDFNYDADMHVWYIILTMKPENIEQMADDMAQTIIESNGVNDEISFTYKDNYMNYLPTIYDGYDNYIEAAMLKYGYRLKGEHYDENNNLVFNYEKCDASIQKAEIMTRMRARSVVNQIIKDWKSAQLIEFTPEDYFIDIDLNSKFYRLVRAAFKCRGYLMSMDRDEYDAYKCIAC